MSPYEYDEPDYFNPDDHDLHCWCERCRDTWNEIYYSDLDEEIPSNGSIWPNDCNAVTVNIKDEYL